MKRAQAYHSNPGPGYMRILLVLVAILCGAIAGISAFSLANRGGSRKAILYGFGAFVATTHFVI